MNLLSEHFGVEKDLKPIFRNFFLLSICFFWSKFFSSEDFLSSFEINMIKLVLTIDDLVDLLDKGTELRSELLFNKFDFFLQLGVEISLLFKIMVDCNRLNLLFEWWKCLDFIDDFLLDIKLLNRKNDTSSSSASKSWSLLCSLSSY